MDSRSIDADDPATWPEQLSALVTEHVGRLQGQTGHASDLPLLEEDEQFRASTEGRGLVVYHCTRLTASETKAVRRDGLRLLDAELVEERIDTAESEAEITHEIADALRARQVFTTGNTTGRADQACFVFGRDKLAEDESLEGFLAAWGGESMYGGPITFRDDYPGMGVGRPSVVVASVPVFPMETGIIFPGFANVLVGRSLGLESPYGVLHARADITVIDIWQPGHPEYDKYNDCKHFPQD